MATTIEELESLINVESETENLEFKAAGSKSTESSGIHKDKILRYCVALSNEGGGKLILGVTNEAPRQVVGTQAARDLIGMQRQIYDTLHFFVHVEEVIHPDGRVVIFNIPPRPRGLPREYNGAYWMRSKEDLKAMPPERLKAIFAEDKTHWLDEFSRTGMTAAEVVELLDTQTLFELLGMGYPSDRDGVIERLISERLIDSGKTGLKIRRVGALLLARQLDAFPDIARKAPRVVVYSGNSKLQTKRDETGRKGYAVGFQSLVKYVMSQLPQNEVIVDALRREVKLVPEIVVRELAANMLIHQEFEEEGTGPMIEIYDNRIQFSNPGDPIVPVDRFIDGNRSRNERLADIMRRFAICEEKSSGIDKVVDAAEVFQLPAPDFRSGYRATHVVMFGPIPFDDMDRNDRIRACYQHASIKFVIGETMTNQTLRKRFALPESKSAIVSQIISATQEAGFIKTDERSGGSRKFARYLPFWA